MSHMASVLLDVPRFRGTSFECTFFTFNLAGRQPPRSHDRLGESGGSGRLGGLRHQGCRGGSGSLESLEVRGVERVRVNQEDQGGSGESGGVGQVWGGRRCWGQIPHGNPVNYRNEKCS